ISYTGDGSMQRRCNLILDRMKSGATSIGSRRWCGSSVRRNTLCAFLLVAAFAIVAAPGIAGATGGTVTAIGQGDLTSCAISDAHAYCWGLNGIGELGNGTVTSAKIPVEVVGVGGSGVLSPVSAISEGATATCAISDAHAYCWGYDGDGQLGNGTATQSAHKTPVEVKAAAGTGHLSSVTAISTGYLTTCAVSSGHAYCWGTDRYGQLGNGTTTTSAHKTPVEVKTPAGIGHLSSVTAISEGTTATCAISSGHAYCWGTDRYGQLGDGTAGHHDHDIPVEVVGAGGSGFLSSVSAISEGFWTTCAIAVGSAYCWGHNNYGQLGQGTATPEVHDTPMEVKTRAGTGHLSTVTAISSGPTNSVCVVSAGNGYCWGWNGYGQHGNGTEASSKLPAEVVGVGGSSSLSTVIAIAAGTFTTCLVTSGGSAYCSGRNTSGQLGNGTKTRSKIPVQVKGVGYPVTVASLYGSTADGTAAAELTRAYPFTKKKCPATRAAVVATTGSYQDGLSSQFLAQSLTTGTLLTPTASLSPETATTLQEEGISSVYIVGGPLAVSNTVQAAIEALPADKCGAVTPTGTIAVQRIYGDSAYATAESIAEHVASAPSMSFAGAYSRVNRTGGTGRYNATAGTGTVAPSGSEPTAILATGTEFQDAQAASMVSYHTAVPLLLTSTTTLSTEAIAAIHELGITQVILIGGPDAITNSVEATLVKLGVSTVRIAGKSYTDTAAELARFEVADTTAGLAWEPDHRVMVARGNGFTDGIAGAVLENKHNIATGPFGSARPLLLTESPRVIGTYLTKFLKITGHSGIDKLAAKKVTSLTILGGPLAVSTSVITGMEIDLTK
ncbi:MAG: cell wall-binding repeat-containing protein, partial [Acidimicrobiales bacterium]